MCLYIQNSAWRIWRWLWGRLGPHKKLSIGPERRTHDSWFLSRTFRHLTYSVSYRILGGGRKEMTISTLSAKPEPAICSMDLYRPYLHSQNRFGGSFIQPESSAQSKFSDSVRSTANIAFRRNCFIWIDLINQTSPICNCEKCNQAESWHFHGKVLSFAVWNCQLFFLACG